MAIRIGRDKILILGFFTIVILLGSILLSLFTATSAVCVTGLITVDTAQFSLFGQSVIMVLIQTGGLGIIAFTTLFVALPRRRISIISQGVISDYTLPEVEFRPKTVLKAIVKYTLIFEAFGFAIYAARFSALGQPLGSAIFQGLFHAVSAFCNAGFSTFTNSLEDFRSDFIVNGVTMILITLGGIGFIVIKDLRKYLSGQRTHLSFHSKIVLKTSLALVLIGTGAFFILEYQGAMKGFPLGERLLASLFQAVTPRTAGFDTIAQSELGPGSRFLTILLMFIGASPASTGGGVKTTVLFVLVMTAFRYHETSDTICVDGRSLSPRTVEKAIGVVVKAFGIILIIAGSIALAESAQGHDTQFSDIIFETISALGTVGLSTGITSTLGGISKALLIATMFIGRVGLFALALPKTERDVEGYALLPKADIML
ncbi:MAG: trk system potassium uptake protein TrkH [Spirochaetes bacterium]|nr:MAG: trk system potassium uptake protein TrkH [Spirochaetota bacterium]